MTKKILHMVSPTAYASPFDVNMAYDAGFDAVMAYGHVSDAAAVGAITQDIIFSRSVKDARNMGLFIGGKDVVLALDMLEASQKAMVPPFEISVFPDPAGSFTTAAAMVACSEKILKDEFKCDFSNLAVSIYGGKGIVGGVAAILCAQAGARVTIIGYDGKESVAEKAAIYKERFGVEVTPADGSSDDKNTALLTNADVIFCAARAGTQVLSKEQLKHAQSMKVAADANAVPPAGIEGVDFNDNKKPLLNGFALGPLSFGDIKIKTQRAMLQEMSQSEKPLYLNFDAAARTARAIVGV